MFVHDTFPVEFGWGIVQQIGGVWQTVLHEDFLHSNEPAMTAERHYAKLPVQSMFWVFDIYSRKISIHTYV